MVLFWENKDKYIEFSDFQETLLPLFPFSYKIGMLYIKNYGRLTDDRNLKIHRYK